MDYISHIKRDNSSGARELENLAREAILNFISKPYSKESLLNYLKKLNSVKPEMASITAITGEVGKRVKGLKNTTLINKEIKKLFSRPSINFDKLAKNVSAVLQKKEKILTYSYSSTVLEILIRLKKNLTVFVPESRPVFEGRKMALKLHQKGIKVKFITDSGISRIIKDVNIVLLGADSVSKNFVINKTGTFSIALLARELKIPCYAVCGKNKFLSGSENSHFVFNERSKNPKEVWTAKGIEIINYYFESVPIKYFTGIITDCPT